MDQPFVMWRTVMQLLVLFLFQVRLAFINTPISLPLCLPVSLFLSLLLRLFVCPFPNNKYLSADRSKMPWCFWWMSAVNTRRSRHQSPAAWLKHTIGRCRALRCAADTGTPRKPLPNPAAVASRAPVLEREKGNQVSGLTVYWALTLRESFLRSQVLNGNLKSPHWSKKGTAAKLQMLSSTFCPSGMRARDWWLRRQKSALTTHLINMNHDDGNSSWFEWDFWPSYYFFFCFYR